MGGQVDMMFSNMATSYPLVAGKKLKVLVTTGTKRSAALPDTPTIAESGLPGYQVYEWNGLFGPAGTPQAIVNRLSALTREVLNFPEASQLLAARGLPQVRGEGETAKWAKVIKQGSIRAE